MTFAESTFRATETVRSNDSIFRTDLTITAGSVVFGVSNTVSDTLLNKVFKAAGVKKIVIACGRTDLRKGIDDHAQLVGTKYDMNPIEKNVLFLFCGEHGGRIKGFL